MNCEEAKLKAQALIDNEIDEREVPSLISHLESCYVCRDEYIALLGLQKRFQNHGIPAPPPEWFESLPKKIARRTGSLVGKIFFYSSYALLLGYALYSLLSSKETGIPVKIALAGIVLGFVVLLGITIVDRITESKNDRYKGVIK
jgi:hypothetical protein